jgi:C-terminal processing protease CtpA/Prc
MTTPSLGLSLDQARPKQPIKVIGIAPGSLASEYPTIRNGDELVRVGIQSVVEMDILAVKSLIQSCLSAPTNDNSKCQTPKLDTPKTICGIGLTVLDDPPHTVTFLKPGGAAAESMSIEIGDHLVAINEELVADLPISEVAKRVLGEEVVPHSPRPTQPSSPPEPPALPGHTCRGLDRARAPQEQIALPPRQGCRDPRAGPSTRPATVLHLPRPA